MAFRDSDYMGAGRDCKEGEEKSGREQGMSHGPMVQIVDWWGEGVGEEESKKLRSGQRVLYT